jgi:hypothetical protein
LLLAAVAFLLADLLASALLTAIVPPLGPSQLSTQRRQLLGGSAATGAAERWSPAPTEGVVEAAPSGFRVAIHPYVGYVLEPGPGAQPPGWSLRVGDLGFLERRAKPPSDAFTVGVFGGSVSALMVAASGDRLSRNLEAIVGRPVAVRPLGIGGHKQPQALMTLVDRLAEGDRFDMVVEVDGYNELIMPLVENLPRGVALSYPREWDLMASRTLDAEEAILVGRASVLRDWRRQVAAGFERKPFLWSATGTCCGAPSIVAFNSGGPRPSRSSPLARAAHGRWH